MYLHRLVLLSSFSFKLHTCVIGFLFHLHLYFCSQHDNDYPILSFGLKSNHDSVSLSIFQGTTKQSPQPKNCQTQNYRLPSTLNHWTYAYIVFYKIIKIAYRYLKTFRLKIIDFRLLWIIGCRPTLFFTKLLKYPSST